MDIRHFEVIEFPLETYYDFIEVVSLEIIILLATLKLCMHKVPEIGKTTYLGQISCQSRTLETDITDMGQPGLELNA